MYLTSYIFSFCSSLREEIAMYDDVSRVCGLERKRLFNLSDRMLNENNLSAASVVRHLLEVSLYCFGTLFFYGQKKY